MSVMIGHCCCCCWLIAITISTWRACRFASVCQQSLPVPCLLHLLFWQVQFGFHITVTDSVLRTSLTHCAVSTIFHAPNPPKLLSLNEKHREKETKVHHQQARAEQHQWKMISLISQRMPTHLRCFFNQSVCCESHWLYTTQGHFNIKVIVLVFWSNCWQSSVHIFQWKCHSCNAWYSTFA